MVLLCLDSSYFGASPVMGTWGVITAAGSALIRVAVTKPNRPAQAAEKKVRNTSGGQKVGLKKPSQKDLVLIQSPGVSMNPMMPVMRNRENQPKRK